MTSSKTTKFGREFKNIIRNNEDNEGEPIFSMPTIKPLTLISNDASYYSLFTSNFSIGDKFQRKFAELIDKPKWNEITFMAQLHENIAANLGAIRCSDMRSQIFLKYKDEISQPQIKKCIEKFKTQTEENYNDIISPINASLFFTLLFIDKELNTKLLIDKKLVIANALTFALWKEKMEIDILLHKNLGETFREYLHYNPKKEKHTETFSNFCNADKYADTIADTLKILGISPWAGIEEVMQILKDVMKTKKNIYGEKGKADRWLREILINATQYFSNDGIYSIEKRHCEDQWFLVEVQPFLNPKLKYLTKEIIHANVAVDFQGNTHRAIEFIDKLKEYPKVKAEMQKVSEEIQDYASTILTGILSKTGEKLLQKTVNYFIFLPFMLQIFREWQKRGLFASLQYSLENTIKTISSRLFIPQLT